MGIRRVMAGHWAHAEVRLADTSIIRPDASPQERLSTWPPPLARLWPKLTGLKPAINDPVGPVADGAVRRPPPPANACGARRYWRRQALPDTIPGSHFYPGRLATRLLWKAPDSDRGI